MLAPDVALDAIAMCGGVFDPGAMSRRAAHAPLRPDRRANVRRTPQRSFI
jgi:hypothetical protein